MKMLKLKITLWILSGLSLLLLPTLGLATSVSPSLSCESVHGLSFLSRHIFAADKVSGLKYFTGDDGSAYLRSGVFNGKPVILKFRDMSMYGDDTVSRFESALIQEGEVLRWLNQYQLGVHFYGFTRIEGHLALIVEKVTEKNITLKEPNESDSKAAFTMALKKKGILVTKETLNEFILAIDILAKNQIMPFDLQFLLTASGKLILIDPEGFRLHQSTDLFTSEAIVEKQKRGHVGLFFILILKLKII